MPGIGPARRRTTLSPPAQERGGNVLIASEKRADEGNENVAAPFELRAWQGAPRRKPKPLVASTAPSRLGGFAALLSLPLLKGKAAKPQSRQEDGITQKEREGPPMPIPLRAFA